MRFCVLTTLYYRLDESTKKTVREVMEFMNTHVMGEADWVIDMIRFEKGAIVR